MNFVKMIFIFQVVSSFLIQARADSDIVRTDVSMLRPTQMNVGMIEVQRKADKLASMKKTERDLFLQENPVPVVLGPSKRGMYLIDHHHLSRAVLESGNDYVYVKVVADFSKLSKEEFWQEMSKNGYVYLKDDRDHNIKPHQLPKTVSELGDDPYRSLAGIVRRNGGYAKNMTPFTEFRWAAFFRQRIEINPADKKLSFKNAIEQAMLLAKSKEAKKLPGYRFQCETIF